MCGVNSVNGYGQSQSQSQGWDIVTMVGFKVLGLGLGFWRVLRVYSFMVWGG